MFSNTAPPLYWNPNNPDHVFDTTTFDTPSATVGSLYNLERHIQMALRMTW
jgi:hypothetical protein